MSTEILTLSVDGNIGLHLVDKDHTSEFYEKLGYRKFGELEVKRTHLPYFFQEDAPPDKAPDQEAPCPCAFGNIYQILSAAGLDVDAQLPWARSWFLKYQMSDGGLSCDEDAYRSTPPASSIVGTIAPLEALLLHTRRPFTAEEARFLDRGAHCLLDRELMFGYAAGFNAEERLDEEDWLKPCFPRFYFYDVIRGLSFVLKWSEMRCQPIPMLAIQKAIRSIEEKSRDAYVRVERQSFEGIATRVGSPSGEWTRSPEASRFLLLDEVSRVGQSSSWLTAQWDDARERIRKLSREGSLA